jgi:exodeoxyribonuclease-5
LAKTLRETPPANPAAGVWDTPAALTLEEWLSRLAEEALLCGVLVPKVLIDSDAEQLLWEKVIVASLTPNVRPLFDVAALASSAANADRLIATWHLPDTDEHVSEEVRLFQMWRQQWATTLAAHQWTTSLAQQRDVIAALEDGALTLPAQVVFAGFDNYTPLQQRLCAALARRGVVVCEQPGELAGEAATSAHAFADTAAQCQAIAQWAQAHLARHAGARLGIVAPNLASVRDRLERALDKALHPHLAKPELAEAPRSYNFSLGKPLDQAPVVAAALDLLALAVRPDQVAQPALSALLRNPYWSAAEEEADDRARLDARLRQDQPFYTSVGALAKLTRTLCKKGTLHCPVLAAHLIDYATALEEVGATEQDPSAWVGTFRAWLTQLRWACSAGGGARPLSSHEYQAKQAWDTVLTQLGSLDAILGPIAVGEAVARLRQLCQGRVFQPQTRGRPSVQVLGMLESAGLAFDAVWVMDMNDHVWPPEANANPLLPLQVQRRHQVPNASAAIQLQHARALLARLRRQAPVLHYSYVHMEDGREMRPSPLIAGIPLANVLPAALAVASALPAALEYLPDATGPAVRDDEKVRGGTWALRAQAICPAWAFFQFRLGASALNMPAEGLDARARGTLIHSALEAFWQKAKSSTGLRQLSATALTAEIDSAVAHSLAAYEKKAAAIPPRYRELERERLCSLMQDWLVVERGRPAFTVVECERKVSITLEGIELRMQIDRIDEQGDRQIIIDYKTGRDIDTANWASDRLCEPQLPIYAVQLSKGQRPGPVGAVAFAKVRLGEMQFGGVAVEDEILPNVRGLHQGGRQPYDPARIPDWSALMDHWEASLTATATELKQGVAGVFYRQPSQLQHCDVKPLLRLAERTEQYEQQAARAAALSISS